MFNLEYTGNGRWLIVKTCSINPVWDGRWYFIEDTGLFEWDQKYFDDQALLVKPEVTR